MVVLTICALAALGVAIWFKSRTPRFSGTSPTAIDVQIKDDNSYSNYYRITVTNRTACEAVVRVFAQARPAFVYSKACGELTFRYEGGKTDVVWVSPGTPRTYYTIYLGTAFRLSSDRFFQVLKSGGVDVYKFPKD